jgi:large subunit ribosomal protein L7/L12
LNFELNYMADDQVKAEEKVERVEEVAEVATEAAEKAEESATEAAEAVEEVKEVAEEVKEVIEAKTEEPRPKDDQPLAEKKPAKPVGDTERSQSVSVSLEKIIEQIEKLSVLELADLVHALEDRFGVSASAPVAISAAGATPAAGAEPAEEKTTFNVILTSAGANKIGAIKAVRELVPTLGLKEAKDLVEAAPKPVLESVNKTTAEEAKTKLTAAGATVELQ